MKIIGVTGGIGSGKTTVCGLFKDLGAFVIDADEISRDITKKGKRATFEIAEYFGEDILLESGELDRKKLSKIVFSDKEKLEKLNEITHKYIFEEMDNLIKSADSNLVILDVPLLFSSDFPFETDLNVGIICDKEVRIKRVEERDNLSREQILKRMENQISDEEIKKKADVIIENTSLDKLVLSVKNIVDSLRNE